MRTPVAMPTPPRPAPRIANRLLKVSSALSASAANFGQTAGAYRDLSNTNDPGGRIVEFQLRLNF